MQNKHFFIFLLFFLIQNLTAQKNYTISGYVEDEASGERLIGAAVYDSMARIGTVTNNYGYFNLSNPPNTEGPTYLHISYIGYQTERLTLNIRGDTTLNIKLSTKNTLQAVEVNAQKQDHIEDRVQMSQVTIPIEQIKRMPMILGEADVLKSLQFLPGVKAGTEGTAGIYVRGGSPDQNLIIMDGVPVYNPAHIGGLFSIFNTDAIKSVSILKGGFPARFSGRLSSVVEVNTKDGDKKDFHLNATIGLLTTKLTLEGPLIKGKLSYMISARRTYYDVILASLFTNESESNGIKDVRQTKINFYDLNAKFNYVYNDKHSFYFSMYNGNDVYKRLESTTSVSGSQSYEQGFSYGNLIGSLRWNWLVKKNLFLNTTFYNSSYGYNFTDLNKNQQSGKPEEKLGIDYVSSVSDWGFRSDFDYNLPNSRLRFGVNGVKHGFRPSETTISQSRERDTLIGAGYSSGLEFSAYVEDELKWGQLSANVGLNMAMYYVRGETFFAPQPRISLSYPAFDGAVKLSYANTTQFVHLLTNDALGLPTDSWVPAVPNIGPQLAHQVAVGYAKTLSNGVELSIEGYYKKMNNLISYKEGSSFLTQDPDWEKKIVQGSGEAYGIEVLLQKNVGKNTGWISYTLAWNNRQFNDINRGEIFPFKFDRRHEFAIVFSRQLSKKVTFSANWTFATGNAITIPKQIFTYAYPSFEFYVPLKQYVYGNRNDYRTKPLHRLDVSFEFYKKRKKYERRWNLGLYNAYSNDNPFYFYIRSSGDSFERSSKYSVVQATLFPVLPSVSYSIKF
jgi:CarboxypepD_reg-like domain/TonB-dependent Receptor Plug Domain